MIELRRALLTSTMLGVVAAAGALVQAPAEAGQSADSGVLQLAQTNPCNPCAAANPCNPCNPCAANNPCNPCAAKANCVNPCAADCVNPCAAANPCNPCAAAAANPCNPCAANPCAASSN